VVRPGSHIFGLPAAPTTILSGLISAEVDADDVTSTCVMLALLSVLVTRCPSPLKVSNAEGVGVITVFLAPSSAVHCWI